MTRHLWVNNHMSRKMLEEKRLKNRKKTEEEFEI